jgi:hypothetical protein
MAVYVVLSRIDVTVVSSWSSVCVYGLQQEEQQMSSQTNTTDLVSCFRSIRSPQDHINISSLILPIQIHVPGFDNLSIFLLN